MPTIDGIAYRKCITKTGGRSLKIARGPMDLVLAFNQINYSLDRWFQPIEFACADGVVVISPEGTFFLKNIQEAEDHRCINVSVFNSPTVYRFPIQKTVVKEPPTYKDIAYHVPVPVDHTDLFADAPKPILIHEVEVIPQLRGTGYSLFVPALNRTLEGKLINSVGSFVTTRTPHGFRVWSVSDAAINDKFDVLYTVRKDINLRLSSRGSFIMNDAGIFNSQTFQFNTFKVTEEGFSLVLSTFDNPTLKFDYLI